MKILNIVGARPNFMKIAPLMEAYKALPEIEALLVHTGQHYDERMSALFFDELGIPQPHLHLNVGSDTQARQVAKIMMAFEEVCLNEKPDAVLVVGDVNSTMACSLVAAKLGIKIIHMEAGLRSFDRRMPEEINRMVTDVLADLLLTPSQDANENLAREGIPAEKVHLVGNIMIDTLFHFLPKAQQSAILAELGLQPQSYALVTLHRPNNVDDPEQLQGILQTLDRLSHHLKIVFPLHPRTQRNIDALRLNSLLQNLIITEPQGYLEFQKLMINARLVITDSGGIQEETTALKIPCITLRENTERPVTVTMGSNEMIGFDMKKLEELTLKAMAGKWKDSLIPPLWDGHTAVRVVEVIKNRLR